MEFETSTNGGSGGRKKSSKACDACSSRKVRCDNLQPQCSRCRNLSLPCEYTRTVKKRGPPKGSSSSTYQRLRRLEELLTSVTSGDANASDVMEVLKRRKTASGATAEQTTVSAPDSDTSTRSSHSESPPSSTEGPSVDATGNGVLGADYGNSGVSIFAQPLDTPDETSFIWDDTFLQPAAPVGDDVVQRTAEFNAEILSAYFNYVSPTMPCVHRQTFLTKLNEQPPELVFAMYACSVPHSSLNSSFSASSATDYGNVYYEKAKALLNPLDSPRVYLSTVQAMLHIVYYITGVGIPSIDVADRYLGMAVTLAKQLGFDNVRLMETLPWLEREARIRTMWCLWIMDKYFVALVHRNPYLHHEWMALPGYAEMDYEAMWNDVSRSALSPTSFVTPNFSNKESATYPFLMEMLTMLKTSSPPPGNPLYIHFHLITCMRCLYCVCAFV
ncbi:hypothetical protein M427DRAFT_388549 [Gonapodya prolifera JEL478]|uniref:Zn(2)-C6 fungal-type domain-containing protein n=1 Tax=Gonapodya prolifera (strain JEL478) TaxID=1344416 RepID=A0A139A7M0_GONPJ|nr:hypothetical protein M427DRAFT_388549 [Gonapodya prolifera JEL478]|eukprot:KXS12796.1 hypothetical protein M427DRAFT_388549 [Gonapodya prolifera JEL478]